MRYRRPRGYSSPRGRTRFEPASQTTLTEPSRRFERHPVPSAGALSPARPFARSSRRLATPPPNCAAQTAGEGCGTNLPQHWGRSRGDERAGACPSREPIRSALEFSPLREERAGRGRGAPRGRSEMPAQARSNSPVSPAQWGREAGARGLSGAGEMPFAEERSLGGDNLPRQFRARCEPRRAEGAQRPREDSGLDAPDRRSLPRREGAVEVADSARRLPQDGLVVNAR
jgi:hypothetical protein